MTEAAPVAGKIVPLVVVTARGGSKRVPGKNLRSLGGRPMISYTADAIAEAGLTEATVLTTDDEEIAKVGRSFGWRVPFTRPPELSGPDAGTVETVLHAIDQVAEETGVDPEFTLILQPTSPFRRGRHIREACKLFAASAGVEAIVGVHALHIGTEHVFTRSEEGRLTRLISGPDRHPVLTPNGSLFLILTEALRRDGSLYAGEVSPYPMDSLASFEIDTELDMKIAESLTTVFNETAR